MSKNSNPNRKLYTAISARKNGALNFDFGIATDPGEIARNLSEVSQLKNYNIAELSITLNKVILNNKMRDYWEDEE